MEKHIKENELKKIISESISKNLKSIIKEDEEVFDPYNYKFGGMSDEEFNGTFDDDENAAIHKELIELMNEGEDIFRRMKETIETSDYYLNNKEKFQSYLEKLSNITDIIENFWY